MWSRLSLLFALVGVLFQFSLAQEGSKFYYVGDFYIFDNADAIADLQLEPAQVEAGKKLRDELAKAVQAKGEKIDDPTWQQHGKEFVRLHDEHFARLQSVFTRKQWLRLQELLVQLAGVRSLTTGKIQRALSFSKAQSDEVDAISIDLVIVLLPEDPTERSKVEQRHDAALKKLEALLTPAQKERFLKMQGKRMKASKQGS